MKEFTSNRPRRFPSHIVSFPTLLECWTHPAQRVNEFVQPWSTEIASCRLAKDFDHLLCQAIMINEEPTERRVREEKPEEIALPIRQQRKVAKNGTRSFIPGENIHALPPNVRRIVFES